MPNYYVYGLNICSELIFPDFPKSKKSVYDVNIRLGDVYLPFEKYREVHLSKLTKVRIKTNNIYLLWNDITIFAIKNYAEIIINPKTGLNKNFIKLLLFSYGFALLLHQKGRLVLHANAVNINDGAVIILGPSGTGKSTTSIALLNKGHELLCDDVLSIRVEGKYPTVYPSFPRIKLWPDVIKQFKEDPTILPKIHSNSDKRLYNVSNRFSQRKKNLKAIYIIKESNFTGIENINSQKATMELIRSSYCYKLLRKTGLAKNLKQCSEVAIKVPIKVLKVKRSFEDFNHLAETIENDILPPKKPLI